MLWTDCNSNPGVVVPLPNTGVGLFVPTDDTRRFVRGMKDPRRRVGSDSAGLMVGMTFRDDIGADLVKGDGVGCTRSGGNV